MTSSLIISIGLLAFACARRCDYNDEYFQNKFMNPPGHYTEGNTDPSTSPVQEVSITIDPTLGFTIFGTPLPATSWATDFGLWYLEGGPNNGGIHNNWPWTYDDGEWAVTGLLAALWYDWWDIDAAEVEFKLIERSDNLDSAGNVIGPDVCAIETAERHMEQSFNISTNISAVAIVTWRETIFTHVSYSQVVLVQSVEHGTYALMKADPPPTANMDWGYKAYPINGIYDTSSGPWASSCDGDMTGKSNSYCGRKGWVFYDLNSNRGKECTAVPNCANPNPDVSTRNINCGVTYEITTACNGHGWCRWTDENKASFKIEMSTGNLPVFHDSFVIVDSTHKTVNSPSCTLVEEGSKYSGTITVANLAACGIAENAGVYTIYVLNYDSSENVSGANGYHGYELYKGGSTLLEVECRPDDVVSVLSVHFNVSGDVASTKVPDIQATLELIVGNMQDIDHGDFRQLTFSEAAVLGTPLFVFVRFDPGTTGAGTPYGIYVESMRVCDTEDCSGRSKNITTNRCRVVSADKAFYPSFEWHSDSLADGSVFIQTLGYVRAARYKNTSSIFIQVVVNFCYNRNYYASSYCKNSCTGLGTSSARKKRSDNDETTAKVLTAKINIVDSEELEGFSACVDETFAYASISCLVAVLLVASCLTVALFVKLQSIRRKALSHKARRRNQDLDG